MWWTHWTVSYVEASGTGNVQAVALTTHNVKWERTHSNHTGMSEEWLLLLESRMAFNLSGYSMSIYIF